VTVTFVYQARVQGCVVRGAPTPVSPPA